MLQARIKLPDSAPAATSSRRPVLILFGGFRRGARALDLLEIEEPALLVTFEYPFDAPRRLVFPQSLHFLPQFRRAVHETFEGIAKLSAALRARPDVDVDRITIAGASAGAPFAIIGAQQNHIPGLVIVQGFGQVRSVIAQQFLLKWQPRYGIWCRPIAWLLAVAAVASADLPEAADYARKLAAGQKVLMITAAEDQRIPKEASDALWQALQRSSARSEKLELAGGHLNTGGSEQIAEILKRSKIWMRREKLL